MSATPAKARLIDAAFALFEERGYENTTVDDITERAGVGRTTFFRAFRSKEDVIFPDHEVLLKAVAARLETSTQGNALVAVTEASRLVLQHYLAEGDLARARYRLTRSVPALRDREIAGTQQYQRLFREFLHQWLGGDDTTALRAELMGNAVVTAHNHVLRRWLRGLTADPEAEFDAAIAETLDLFTTPDSGDEVGTLVVFRTAKNVGAVLPGLRKLLGEPELPA